MKNAKTLLYALVLLGAIVAFGWFFVSQLGSSGRQDGLAGVLLSAPRDWRAGRSGICITEEAMRVPPRYIPQL